MSNLTPFALDAVIAKLPEPVREKMQSAMREATLTILIEDTADMFGARLADYEINAVRLSVVALNLRRCLVSEEVVATNGARAITVIESVDSVLNDVNPALYAMIRRESEAQMPASVSDEVRQIIRTIRANRRKGKQA